MPKQETNQPSDSLEKLMLEVAQMRDSIDEKIAARKQSSAASQGSPSSVAAKFSPSTSPRTSSKTALIAESFFSGPTRSKSPTGFHSRHQRSQGTNPCARAQDLTALVAAFNSPPASPTRSPKKKATDGTPEYGFSPYSPVGPR